MTVASPAATATPPEPPAGGLAPPQAAKRRGNPKGNPGLNLSPRCGARTRAGCPCQAPAIRGKLRCRMHGGRSTGPRTPEGLARLRSARTVHGRYGANARAFNRWKITLLRRIQVERDVLRYQGRLPPELAARARREILPELMLPPRPIAGISAAEGRALRQSVDASLRPWRQVIAAARAAVRAEREAAHAARPKPHAPARRPRAAAPRLGVEGLLAALLARLHAPVPVQGHAGGAGPLALSSPGAGAMGWRQDSLPEAHTPVLGQSAGDGAGPRTAPSPDAGVRERQRDSLSEAHALVAAPHERDAVPPGLTNRAARRRWKWEQHQARKLAAGSRP